MQKNIRRQTRIGNRYEIILKLTDEVIKQNLRQLVLFTFYTGWSQVYSILKQ